MGDAAAEYDNEAASVVRGCIKAEGKWYDDVQGDEHHYTQTFGKNHECFRRPKHLAKSNWFEGPDPFAGFAWMKGTCNKDGILTLDLWHTARCSGNPNKIYSHKKAYHFNPQLQNEEDNMYVYCGSDCEPKPTQDRRRSTPTHRRRSTPRRRRGRRGVAADEENAPDVTEEGQRRKAVVADDDKASDATETVAAKTEKRDAAAEYNNEAEAEDKDNAEDKSETEDEEEDEEDEAAASKDEDEAEDASDETIYPPAFDMPTSPDGRGVQLSDNFTAALMV